MGRSAFGKKAEYARVPPPLSRCSAASTRCKKSITELVAVSCAHEAEKAIQQIVALSLVAMWLPLCTDCERLLFVFAPSIDNILNTFETADMRENV